ncbi:MAG: protein phosphatase 2C domain-containing protein, partial [Pyrinomonadaceae bacterium]
MTDTEKKVQLQSAAVTDRGLSEKRPLNEDSFLADSQRRIFAVADGVGGAEAGEVASQTAVEVLDEAFRYHEENVDMEDLMEIAIQRANASIYRMSRESPRLSMMATTVVALHLDGRNATIGHVGDSRLYRVSPEGQIFRETADHSVVEEEVRAGRMTPDQAANHPSRNVISRALGAEDSVEVDMKRMEVEDGTTFLLCSDGITRHIPDNEIRKLLLSSKPADEICEEMKRICYERGAEDNLTAVLVRVGDFSQVIGDIYDDEERTISTSRSELAATLSGEWDPAAMAEVASVPEQKNLTPPSRIAFPTPDAPREDPPAEIRAEQAETVRSYEAPAKPAKKRGALAAIGFLLLFVLIIAGVAASFYGGMRYQKTRTEATIAPITSPNAMPTAPTRDESVARFEQKLSQIDRSPSQWLETGMKAEMASQGIDQPLKSADPEFLYLYGRALFLKGDTEGAIAAFYSAIAKAEEL